MKNVFEEELKCLEVSEKDDLLNSIIIHVK